MSGLLVVGAHPDDAEHLAGGVARAEAERSSRVVFLVLTDGERWHADESVLGRDEIATVRREEARHAASQLGAVARFAGLPDGELDGNRQLPCVLVQAIRELRPEKVVTHNPNEGHPDHKAAAAAVLRVCNVLGEPAPIENPRWFPAAGPPHAIDRLYFAASGKDLYRETTILIDTSACIDDKVRALLCHASQYSDPVTFEQRIRLTGRATGHAAGYEYAEAFLPAPGYNPRLRYTHLP